MSIAIIQFPFESKNDVHLASQRARLLGALSSLPRRKRVNLGKAISGICRSLLDQCLAGTVEFGVKIQGKEQSIEATVRSNPCATGQAGQSIATPTSDDVSRHDWDAVRQLVDGLRVSRGQAGSTTARLFISLPAGGDLITEHEASEWAVLLRETTFEDALAASWRRIHDLTAQLSARDVRDELEQRACENGSTTETLALLSLVASKTDNAVVIMDADGSIEWVNDAFVHMTGYSLNEVMDRRPDEVLFGPSTDSDSIRDIEESFQRGHGLSEEFLQYRPDGRTYWALLNLTAVLDEHGSVCRWIAVGADITKRRQAQMTLEAAKEAAEAANRAKSEFLANVSHEIRTPLNAVIGMTELALCTELSGDQREYLTTVKESADSLLELLNDILDLSKIEAGKMEIESIPSDLIELIEVTSKSLAARAEKKGLRLDWQVADDVPRYVLGDPTRLRQVLVNLADNAIKFTDQGEIIVQVENQWQSDGEVRVHFSIRDTGIGIPPDKLDRIFEAFTQADSSTTRRFGGTGLGLAISSELVQLMQGKIWVQSETGRGSTFHFSMRFKIADENAIQNLRDEQEAVSRTTRSTNDASRPLAVLVADDHEANRILAGKILQKRGHRVAFAASGEDALIALKRERFDVVLMDVQMPETDGLEATKAIRQWECHTGTHLPIIALTAHSMKGDREKCLAAGMDAYLPKPLRAQQLQRLVERLGDVTSMPQPDTSLPDESIVPTTTELDFGPALERLDHDIELLKEQMRLFLDDSPELVSRIDAAITHRDGKTLQITAHRLRGLIAGYDYHEAADSALNLEIMGRNETFDDARAEASQFAAQVCELRQAMEKYL